MQKLFFTLLLSSIIHNSVFSQWDRHMELKKMDIKVTADAFVATTFIEMEFYNPGNTEMEGLYSFQLEPGQAITAFQLDLFGKYRDGSIEEKWKATNAYNTIVGKRVDPALLRMDYMNNYSLRIYPVPANSSRKITMTIQQLLVLEKEAAIYKLPLNIKDNVKELNVSININGSTGYPSVLKGLLTNQLFNGADEKYSLTWKAAGVKVDQPLSFSIPLSIQQPVLCVKQVDKITHFALRLRRGAAKVYRIQPRKVTVYWDASVSGNRRNIGKEISFLKQYVATNAVEQLTIIPFNQRTIDTAVFYTAKNFNSRWIEYLESLSYEGATNYGSLDFSTTSADAIFLFSDGRNSFGSGMPITGRTHVYCVSSAPLAFFTHLKKIVGQTGGRLIDLGNPMNEALETASMAENILFGLMAGDSLIRVDPESLSLKRDEVLLLTGTMPSGQSSLRVVYGNNGKVNVEEMIALVDQLNCDYSAIDRIRMLSVFDSYTQANANWMNALEFGKKEKVVTLNTAYIVLEKLDDYIKFNIMPPKELESQCDMNIFVKADELRRNQYKKLGETDVLKIVAAAYNERMYQLDPSQPYISVNENNIQPITGDKQKTASTNGAGDLQNGLSGKVTGVTVTGGGAMEEVVVTALGQSRQSRELGYSVSKVHASELTQAKPVSLANGLTGRVSGLNVTTVNSGVFADTRITLRGIRSLTGNNQPMLVLDGVPIDLRYLSSINPNDVSDVTVLKSASATAIYGPDGANGALVVQTKKSVRGRYRYYNSSYKLKNMEDEDYLTEVKEAAYGDKMTKYYELKNTHGNTPGFYFDIAQHLYEAGYRKNALNILFSAAGISEGERSVMMAIGYTLENWKQFEEAINVYKQMLCIDSMDVEIYRDLAMAYYQAGKYQEAVNTFYRGLISNKDSYEYYNRGRKATMLYEMNAIIAIHREQLDLSGINSGLIRPVNSDLRITLDCNNQSLNSNVIIIEPDGKECNYSTPSRKGRLITNYFDYWVNRTVEYQVKNPDRGAYKIKLNYYDYAYYAKSATYSKYQDALRLPTMVRITTFRNFGKTDQTIQVENVIMDNQNGNIEIAEIKW